MASILDTQEMLYKKFEPKVKFRYIFYIDGISEFLIKSANRPSIESEAIEMNYINLRWWAKGKTKWGGTTQITLIDPIAPSGAQEIQKWVNSEHESITGRDGYMDFYKRNATLSILGPDGSVVEEWKYIGIWPSSVEYGDLSWDSGGEIMTINVTFNYDDVILNF